MSDQNESSTSPDTNSDGDDIDSSQDLPQDAGRPSAVPDSPQQRIAALEAERNEARDRMLRVAADFENYKKRVRKEQADSETKARDSVLRDVLEVADNLERAASVDERADFKSLQKGIELVNRLFQGKLERHDVRPFDSKGQPFDPRIHDAVSQLPTAEVAPGSVVSEVQKGYRIGDRLLRPALVVVAVALPAAPGSPDGAGGGSHP
jgi:molecular chaperone GrpE